MALPDNYAREPWSQSHRVYDSPLLSISPAPEFCTAEVLVASTYRASGYAGYGESRVPASGREFDKTTRASKTSKEIPGRISADTWRTIIHGVLDSPKQPNQSSKRFLQLNPLVPQISMYSGSARLTGSSWNPGGLVQRMISMGSDSAAEADALWARLFEALSVASDDDIWARWLTTEFEARSPGGQVWARTKLPEVPFLSTEDRRFCKFPARQLTKDLDASLHAKHSMTRRQWISVLEATLRLASGAHVLWACSLNAKVWSIVRSLIAAEENPPSMESIRARLVSTDRRYLSYGTPAISDIRHYASDYLSARLGINALLWVMQEEITDLSIVSCDDLRDLFSRVIKSREALVETGFLQAVQALLERESRTVACKKGVGSNIVEFLRHTLGQRQTADEILRGYDQGYVLKKRGEAASSPWSVSFGPVAILSLVHSCLRESAGPRSVRTLCDHLASYGIDTDIDDVTTGELGQQLRMLGLVLDSPDAENGMLLVPPF